MTDRRTSSAIDVATTPMTDLNIRKDEIPAVLDRRAGRPYELPGSSAARRSPLPSANSTRVLGDDIDVPRGGAKARISAGRVAQVGGRIVHSVPRHDPRGVGRQRAATARMGGDPGRHGAPRLPEGHRSGQGLPLSGALGDAGDAGQRRPTRAKRMPGRQRGKPKANGSRPAQSMRRRWPAGRQQALMAIRHDCNAARVALAPGDAPDRLPQHRRFPPAGQGSACPGRYSTISTAPPTTN